MSSHEESRPTVEENTCHSDEIDALVRWALRDLVAGKEPPPAVWDKIRARLEQPRAQSDSQRGRLLLTQFSWVVQFLVLGIIIPIAFGLSLSQGFDWLDHEHVVNGKLTPQVGSEEVVRFLTEDDVLSGHYFFHSVNTTTVVSKTSPLSLSKSAVFERTSSFDGSTELAEARPRMAVSRRKRAYRPFLFQ